MLAALLLNLPRGGPDGDAPRNRGQRRAYHAYAKQHHKARLEEYLAKRRTDEELTRELMQAYDALRGNPQAAEALEQIVSPFQMRDASGINFAGMAIMLEAAKELLTFYYALTDGELLLILASSETP